MEGQWSVEYKLDAKEFTEWEHVLKILQIEWNLFMQACHISKTYF